MIYFSEKYAEIAWEEQRSIVKVTFKGYMDSNQLQKAYEEVLKCACEYKAIGIFVDGRIFVTVRPGDQEWLSKVWLPQIIQLKVKKIARILPENMVQRQVIGKMDQVLRDYFEFQDFSNVEEGMRWLTK
jgi:hypothetical protein